MKILIIICICIGSLIGIFKAGYDVCKNEYEDAYEAFSFGEFPTTLPVTFPNGMHGFQYKSKSYPLMTTELFREVLRSQIWFGKDEKH